MRYNIAYLISINGLRLQHSIKQSFSESLN